MDLSLLYQELHTRRALEVRYLLDPRGLLFDDALAFLCGNAGIDLWCVSHVSGSKSVPSGSRFERSGGACLSPSYTRDWLFSKFRHLAILSNGIKPWPMTLAPTNETIRCEIMQKKTQRVKKVPLWFGNIKVRCKDSIYQISVRLTRVGANYYYFWFICLWRGLLSGY